MIGQTRSKEAPVSRKFAVGGTTPLEPAEERIRKLYGTTPMLE